MSDSVRDFDQALGYLVRAASRLEMAIRALYVELLGSPHGNLIAAGLPVERMLQGIDKLLTDEVETGRLPQTAHDRIEVATKSLLGKHGLLDRRNDAVHGAWTVGVGEDGIQTTRRSRYWQPKPEPTTWTVSELTAVANLLANAAYEIRIYAAAIALRVAPAQWTSEVITLE